MIEGIKIIDLTRNLAGPFCTMILADMGANVIKVEVPGKGEDGRIYGPFINGESGYFMSLNRNKRGVTLDLQKEKGKDILRKLLMDADVMIDSFRPGVTEKLGFSYDQVKNLNPKLICVSISGFGHTGPYRHKAAYDMVVQGYGGIMSITGQVNGTPTRVGPSIGDLVAGLYTAIGILGSLQARARTGKGDFLDMSMMDCQVSILENAVIRYFGSGIIPKPMGNRHASITPFESMKSKDGHIIICATNENQWEKLCGVLKCEELLQDPRFKTNSLRTENHDLLQPLLEGILAAKTIAEWIPILDKAGIPCGPVNTIDTLFTDEQVRARDMIRAFEHPKAGVVKVANNAIRSANNPVPTSFNPPPLVGQHNVEILHSLGFKDDEIETLKKEKVI